MKNLIKIMKEKAKAKRRKIVIGEGWDERCLKAADYVLREGYADLILLGDEKKIKEEAKKFKADITAAEIINNKSSDMRDKLAEKLVELRKHKGMTKEKALEFLDDVNYFGTMLVETGYADGLAGSTICSTAELMRPALQILKTKTDAKLASEVIISEDVKNKRVLFLTDVSLNIEPDEEELAHIAVNAADLAKSFGFEPKVALLSFSTKGSGGDAEIIQKTRKAAEIAQKLRPDYVIDAEYQGDAATNPHAAKRKCPGARIMGDANVLVFPNLTTGNILAHLLTQLSDMRIDLSALCGIKKPVMILGRSTPLQTVTNLMIMTAFEVHANEEQEKARK